MGRSRDEFNFFGPLGAGLVDPSRTVRYPHDSTVCDVVDIRDYRQHLDMIGDVGLTVVHDCVVLDFAGQSANTITKKDNQ